MQAPKNGSPFRNLNRRGGSLPLPPLVSVDLFNSLRPKSRSCHRRPIVSLPLQESCMRWTKAIGLLASAPAPRSMLLTVIPAFSLLKICFFTVPFEFKQCRRSAKAQFSPCPIRYERLSASARRVLEAGEWSPAAWPRRSPGRCAGAPPR